MKKNYEQLWQNLMAILQYGGKESYNPAELLRIMTDMEAKQVVEEAATRASKKTT